MIEEDIDKIYFSKERSNEVQMAFLRRSLCKQCFRSFERGAQMIMADTSLETL